MLVVDVVVDVIAGGVVQLLLLVGVSRVHEVSVGRGGGGVWHC